MRYVPNQAADQAHFRRTAVTTKAVNLNNFVMRGGIRF